MRDALFIARNDLAQMLRARETLLWVFVMPALFFYFIGTVTGGMSGSASSDRPDALALDAPADAGFLVDELVRRLEAQNFRVERPDSPEAFEGYSRRLVVPRPASGKPRRASVSCRWMSEMTRVPRFSSIWRNRRTRAASSIFCRMMGWSEEMMKKIQKKSKMDIEAS